MRRSLAIVLTGAVSTALLFSTGCATNRGASIADSYAPVLADSNRPEEERARDNARRVAATLGFARVNPGQTIGEMIIGGGYFTRIFASAVGDSGRVVAWQPAEFIAFQPSYGEALTRVDAEYRTVSAIRSPIAAPEFPARMDLIFTAQNYHDLHLEAFPADTAARVNAAVFRALKPGGLYVIVDHSAVPGAGLAVANSLHRIDVADVKREVEAAGFVLEAESQVLANPSDPRTGNVFEPPSRGQTDQFMLRFRKPR